MKNKQRELRMQIKSLNEDGTFEGMLSPYGNVDQGSDVVEAGAFTQTLADNGDVVPMLWQHIPECPIGELTLIDTPEGLACKGRLMLDKDDAGNYLIPEAAKAYVLLKAGIIKGLSIGYDAVKAQVVNGIRHLKQIRLYEGSVVTFPMNLGAGVSSVKRNEIKGDFADAVADNQLRNASYLLLGSLSDALQPLPWSGNSRAEILAAAQTSLEEFSAAYLAYLPEYLDYLQREYGMDTKQWTGKRELKEGRKLSGDTKKTLSDAHEHVKAAFDVLDGLLSEDDAGDETLDDPEDDPEAKSLLSASMKSMSALLKQ